MYIYDSTINRLPSSGAIGVNDLAASTAGAAGTAACGFLSRVACADFVLGAQFLMGSQAELRAAALVPPTDPDADAFLATLLRWTTFFKRWARPATGKAGLLLSDLIHIQRPTSRRLTVVAHVSSGKGAPERALVALVNPTPRTLWQNVTVDLYYSGLAPGSKVVLSGITPAGNRNVSAGTIHHLLGEAACHSGTCALPRDVALYLGDIPRFPHSVCSYRTEQLGMRYLPHRTTRWASMGLVCMR